MTPRNDKPLVEIDSSGRVCVWHLDGGVGVVTVIVVVGSKKAGEPEIPTDLRGVVLGKAGRPVMRSDSG